jgi:hypothetical protein
MLLAYLEALQPSHTVIALALVAAHSALRISTELGATAKEDFDWPDEPLIHLSQIQIVSLILILPMGPSHATKGSSYWVTSKNQPIFFKLQRPGAGRPPVYEDGPGRSRHRSTMDIFFN